MTRTLQDYLREALEEDQAAAGAAEAAPPPQLDPTRPLSSWQLLNLLTFLEGELGLNLGDEDLANANFESVAAIEAMVARRQAADSRT